MIETTPPLDEVERYYEDYQKMLKRAKKSLEGFPSSPPHESDTQLLFAITDSIMSFVVNQAGMNVGFIKMIRKLSEMTENHVDKEEVRNMRTELETMVQDTLIPLKKLVDEAKFQHIKKDEHVGIF